MLVAISRLAREEQLALVVVSHRREDLAHFEADGAAVYEAIAGLVQPRPTKEAS